MRKMECNKDALLFEQIRLLEELISIKYSFFTSNEKIELLKNF